MLEGNHRAADTERALSWKVFGVLLAASLVATIALLPYLFTLQADALESAGVPLWLVAVSSVIQTMILVAMASGLGLWLGSKVGLGAPLLRAWLRGEQDAGERIRATLPTSIGLGVLASVLIILLDLFLFGPLLGEAMAGTETPAPGALQGLLASLYGGIVEEILLRLGLMTTLVWVGGSLARQERPGSTIYYSAIVLAAILFGVGHLPAAAVIFPLTPLWVSRIILLNSIGGLAFGWLYWRKGLLAAIIGHFSADIVLHVLLPLLGQR